MTHCLTSDGGQHFSSRDAELLADLRKHRGVNLGGVSVARQWEEVCREVLLEPLVFPDSLDGDTLHRVHLGGGVKARITYVYICTGTCTVESP